MTEVQFNPVGGYTLVAILAAGLLLLIAAVGFRGGALNRRRRAVLLALRGALVLLALVALLRPVVVYTQLKKQKSTLVIMVDHSRSMKVADALGGRTRWQAVKSAVTDALPQLASLGDDLEVQLYGFDASLRPLRLSKDSAGLPAEPQGIQTALGAALEDMLRQQGHKRLAGVILLSDGAQRAAPPRDTPPQTPVRRLADLGYPFYGLAIGQPRGLGQARDIALKDLLVNPTVYVKNVLTVTSSARVEGFTGQNVVVQLLFETPGKKMAAVASKQIRAVKDGESIPLELAHVPEIPGEYKVTLRAQPGTGELVTTNNELSTFVTVLKGGIKVLYLESPVRIEQKFLRRSLDASPDIKVDYRQLQRPASGKSPISLGDLMQPGKYDVYVLGDVDSSLLAAEDLKNLATAVERGAGLIMLGGFHSFGPGGYGETPLARLSPVRMDALDRQPFDERIRTDVHIRGPLKMLPSEPLGSRHYIMTLARDGTSRQVWESLPALEGANKLGTPKRGAQVLAQTRQGTPLLVAHEAGGRVLAFAVDSTWHWWMRGRQTEHKRFWRQVVLWLARKDELGEGSVWVKLPQRRFAPGTRVEFMLGARTAENDPIADAQFEVEVVDPAGARHAIRPSRQGDELSGTFDATSKAGDYKIEVRCQRQGQTLGSAQSRFLVFEQDLELDNPAADPGLLAALAQMTADAGGQSMAVEELPQLIERIRNRPTEYEIASQKKDTWWDSWPFFLCFVGLASLEWYLRKRWGLV